MIFKGVPNMTVTITNPRYGEVKRFRFDENGLYETEHPVTIQRLQKAYPAVDETEKPAGIICKKCGATGFTNQGELLAHYRKDHKKEN
jgi:hypothetical protein